MNYSAVHKKWIIDEKNIDLAVMELKYAMQCMRKIAGVTLGKRKRELGTFNELDSAEKSILDAAKLLGIDFGVERGHELDLTDIN